MVTMKAASQPDDFTPSITDSFEGISGFESEGGIIDILLTNSKPLSLALATNASSTAFLACMSAV